MTERSSTIGTIGQRAPFGWKICTAGVLPSTVTVKADVCESMGTCSVRELATIQSLVQRE